MTWATLSDERNMRCDHGKRWGDPDAGDSFLSSMPTQPKDLCTVSVFRFEHCHNMSDHDGYITWIIKKGAPMKSRRMKICWNIKTEKNAFFFIKMFI